MTRLNQYIDDHYEWMLGEVKRNIAKGMMREYADDLLHHVIIDLYNLPDEKIDQMIDDGKLGNYVVKGCALQLKSSSSPFYRTHRKFKMSARGGMVDNGDNPAYDEGYYMNYGEEVPEELSECLKRAIDELHWYKSQLIRNKFYDKMTYEEIYKYYNISKNHLYRDINEALDSIRETCKEAR